MCAVGGGKRAALHRNRIAIASIDYICIAMFFQSQVTREKERINLTIAVRVSNDTAMQDCEVRGRCLLPLYPQVL